MLARGAGTIVFVSSLGGRIPIPERGRVQRGQILLGAVRIFTAEAMALDLGGTGVAVKLVLPGPIDTEIWDQPGNAALAPFETEKVSATDCASGIADAARGRRVRVLRAAGVPGRHRRQGSSRATKSAACDSYIKGMTDVATALRNP